MKYLALLLVISLVSVAVMVSAHAGHDHNHDDHDHDHEQAVESGHPFGEAYNWRSLEDGLNEVRTSGKPGLILIHKEWCGACKRLAPLFKADTDLLALSSKFVMIAADEEPDKPEYEQDGAYVPRIFFTNADGEVRAEMFNEKGNMEYKYYYADPKLVVESMQRVLNTHSVQNAADSSEL